MNTFSNVAVEEKKTSIIPVDNMSFVSSIFNLPVTHVAPEPNTLLKREFAGLKMHHISRSEWMRPDITRNDRDLAKTSLFMQALADSWSSHVQFSLSPEVAWYILAHEIAAHVNLNAQQYRGLFTKSDRKEIISIRDDNLVYGQANGWTQSLSKFLPQIRSKVPQSAVDLMLPHFSTSTEESDTANLVLFMNMLSNYFNYQMVTLCGIPAVKVVGNAGDWKKVADQVELARNEFPGLKPWFSDLLPVLQNITDSMNGHEVEPDFWAKMYEYDGGCGGNSATVRGWITTFFAHSASKEGFRPRYSYDWRHQWSDWNSRLFCFEFPPHVAFVPFKWEYHKSGKDAAIPMLLSTGIFGVEFEGALTPKLGFAVLEDSRTKLEQ